MEKYKKIFLLIIFIAFLTQGLSIEVCYSKNPKRYIFIDAGAHLGEVTDAFKGTDLYHEYSWEIYAIEADSHFAQKITKAADVTVINKAAWTYDGTLNFFLALPGDTRSSVYHLEEYNKTKVSVECFDFGAWIKSEFRKEDYLILSMDMAGSEYEVLDKMIRDGSIEYVDRLYVEFSAEMFIGGGHSEKEAYNRAYEIIQKVRGLKILFDGDSAEDAIKGRKTWQDHL